jgi:FtsP/CotA-like multicopper oxidase with cupredoxin domain
MTSIAMNRRAFLKTAAGTAGLAVLPPLQAIAQRSSANSHLGASSADYTLNIRQSLVEIAKNRFVSTTTFNDQFPGPLLRFHEGERVTIEIHNETENAEQLHWHGQTIPSDVDGAAEEGTPFILPASIQRISFVPQPSGLRLYHSHLRAGGNLNRGQYGGQVGPVYIQPKNDSGSYDREIFLTLKEFEPWFSQGGDMSSDFLAGPTIPELKQHGESEMDASLKQGNAHGFEVNYRSFTINGRMLGHGEPIRVKHGDRVLFHVINGSATEIRSLALPGHSFTVIALDGNMVPHPARVPVLWLGTAERISAVVEMNHPGVWVLGETGDDDRHHGMGIVVEYAGQRGKPVWLAPRPFRWNYLGFGYTNESSAVPDEVFEMTFAKQNAAEHGFNRWTINGTPYPDNQMMAPAKFRVNEGKKYRIRMRNASDDIHPIHLHRHSFELTRIAGKTTSGVMKDVVMLGGYQEAEVDFIANNPGMTLFHCHQQLHMDFGFMGLFEYA